SSTLFPYTTLFRSDLLLLERRELLGGLQMQIAGGAVGGAVGYRLTEGHVQEVLALFLRLAGAVGPQLDHALGALDVFHQVAQPLHEAAARGIAVFTVDDLVADGERPQL